jgi:hypothetical protein
MEFPSINVSQFSVLLLMTCVELGAHGQFGAKED